MNKEGQRYRYMPDPNTEGFAKDPFGIKRIPRKIADPLLPSIRVGQVDIQAESSKPDTSSPTDKELLTKLWKELGVDDKSIEENFKDKDRKGIIILPPVPETT